MVRCTFVEEQINFIVRITLKNNLSTAFFFLTTFFCQKLLNLIQLFWCKFPNLLIFSYVRLAPCLAVCFSHFSLQAFLPTVLSSSSYCISYYLTLLIIRKLCFRDPNTVMWKQTRAFLQKFTFFLMSAWYGTRICVFYFCWIMDEPTPFSPSTFSIFESKHFFLRGKNASYERGCEDRYIDNVGWPYWCWKSFTHWSNVDCIAP